eukprot:12150603-Karenia_brevis.AAC.1
METSGNSVTNLFMPGVQGAYGSHGLKDMLLSMHLTLMSIQASDTRLTTITRPTCEPLMHTTH